MRSDNLIYLDYNATTPIDPRVADSMQPYLRGGFGNPSSAHRLGREARAAVDAARSQVATAIGAEPDEIVFTSGGSESNNLAITGSVASGGHIITVAIEHPAVLEVVRALRRSARARVTIIGVDAFGRLDPGDVEAAFESDTRLVSVMLANNEVGTIQPIAEVAALCGERGVRMHTDAAQAVGKIPVDVRNLGCDLLTIAGHKLYAPKGIGALYVRRGTLLEPLIRGAAHERGLRAGTENTPHIVALGRACELVTEDSTDHGASLRDRLQSALTSALPGSVVHGHPEHRLPNTLSIALAGVDVPALLGRLSESVAASAGAACHADTVKMSSVLEAMNVEPAIARSTLRLSVGRFTDSAQIDDAVARILGAARALLEP